MQTRILMATIALVTVPVEAAEVCPGGRLAVMRVSAILPKGSMAGFREAARDHVNWYKNKGMAVTQFVAPVMTYSAKAKAQVVSDREVMTVRVGDTPVPAGAQDAGWKAFVAKYQANSRIVREMRTCFPKAF